MAVQYHTHTFDIPVATDAEAAAGVVSDKVVVPSNLGSSATKDIGTTGGTVAAGDDSRITGAAQKSANLSDLASAATARNNLGLGTAAVENATAFATSAQGTKADTAVQPARSVASGTGLTGGGDLSADRTIALNASSVASLALADTALQAATFGSNSTVLEVIRDQNPELPMKMFMDGHEGDADHTGRFNEAIDRINAVTGQKGGTIRLDKFRYKVGSVQAIANSAVTIAGVGTTCSVFNVPASNEAAKAYGTVIESLAVSGDMFSWGNQDGGSGYVGAGGGLRDLAIFADDKTGGYIANVMRWYGWICERVVQWRPLLGVRSYGSFNVLLADGAQHQLRGEHANTFTGDALNKGDVFDFRNWFIGAEDAQTSNNGVGLLWRGNAHSVGISSLRIVNPDYGLYVDDGGLSTDNVGMRPMFLRSNDLEVDFARNEAIRALHFRDFELVNSYFHSFGTSHLATFWSHLIGGVNYNGQLRLKGGVFSNGANSFGPGQIQINCNTALIEGVNFQPPSAAGKSIIAIEADSRKVKVQGCQIGESYVYTNPATTTGVNIASGALQTSIVGNDFYNCATAINDGATAGQTFTDANKIW